MICEQQLCTDLGKSCCFGPEMHQSASQSDQLDSPKKNVQIVQKVSFFTSGKQTYSILQS